MNQVISELKEGNLRFVTTGEYKPNVSGVLRKRLASRQAPFAAVLTCSDSRVIPEAIFDVDLGDLFVIRVAGNIADDVTMASLAYAVHHLGIDTVVVLGHTNCGAIGAAIQRETEGEVGYIIRKIKAAIGSEADSTVACRHNVASTVCSIATALGASAQCVGAIYDIVGGKVEFLD